MLDMLEYHNLIKKLNIDIIYSGPLWETGIEGIGSTLKKRMEFDKLPLSASQSIFSVFVEQMNNMLIYSANKEDSVISHNEKSASSKGVFLLGVTDKTYFLQSGNITTLENAELIKKQIDFLNTLDKAGLRNLYKRQLKGEPVNIEIENAELGLIEIARRASSPIKYSTTLIDDKLLFFAMFVTIG